MKITFLVPEGHFSGGVKVVAIQAERLKKRGHQVVVVSPSHRIPTLRERVRSVRRGGHFFQPPRGMQSVPTVGFLAAHSPFKGMKTVLGAITRIRETIPNLRILAFGQDDVRADLAPFPNSEFHLLPAQDKIRDIYAQCDVWMCGSQREGFHLPPLEAMACRCPVVPTRVGGPEDIIVPNKNGFLVELRDSEGLAAATTKLLTGGKENWQQFSDAALATANGYTWDDAAALFEKAAELAVERAARGEIDGGRRVVQTKVQIAQEAR